MFKLSQKGKIETRFGQKNFRRTLLSVFLLFLVILSVLVWGVLEYNRLELLKQRAFDLEVVLKTTNERLNIWFETHSTYLLGLAHDPDLVLITEALLKSSSDPEALPSSSALHESRQFFSRIKNIFGEQGFFIINPKNINVGSMRASNLGTHNLIAEHQPDLLTRVFQGETLFIPPIQSEIPSGTRSDEVAGTTSMFFAAPIRNRSGDIIAVLTQQLDPLIDFSKVLNLGQIGETGETYAFSWQGKLLSESRFNYQLRAIGLIGKGEYGNSAIDIRDPGGNLLSGFKPDISANSRPLTRMAKSAISGEAGADITGYRDYRGVPVIGAWLWNDTLDMGLTTEMDLDEALSSYYLIRGSILSVLALTILLSSSAIFFTLFTGQRASRKLQILNHNLSTEIGEREKAETALLENEVQLTATFEQASVGFALVNSKSGKFLRINQKFSDIVGYSSEEMLTLDFMGITHPDDLQQDLDNMQLLFEGKIRDYSMEKRYFRSDGSIIWVDLSVSPLWKVGEEPDMHIAVIADITDRKRAETELQKHQEHLEELVQQRTQELSKANNALLESNSDHKFALNAAQAGTLILDFSSGYLHWDDRSLEIFGMKREDFDNTYETWAALVHPDDLDKTQTIVKNQLKFGQVIDIKYRCISPNGDIRHIWAIAQILRDDSGNPLKLTGLHFDETELVLAQKALLKSKEAAEIANQAKSTFLSSMSHELRTPLNAIMGFTQLMARNRSFTTEQQQTISIINNSGKHLLELINDILDLSKIEAGAIELKARDFDLDSLIWDVSEMLANQAEEKGLQFIVDQTESSASFIHADEGKLRQILLNLLSNAVKFTSKGSVTLRVKTIPVDNKPNQAILKLEVKDTGSGIPADQIDSIFDPFFQAKNCLPGTKGTGLGLAISKSLVELIEGNIHVESTINRGSLFSVEFPVSLTNEATSVEVKQILQTVSGLEPGQTAWRILVAEDNSVNALLLTRWLNEIGFETHVAKNGKEAIDQFKQWQPHFIWMDMHMPVMDGYIATKGIRALPGGNQVKIVALTAHAFKKQKKLIMDAGCDGLILKPFRAEDIFETMGQLLGVRYVYETAEEIVPPSEPARVSVAPEVIATLPSDLVEALQDAACEHDLKKAHLILDKISVINPELANTMHRMLDDFDFSTLKKLMSAESIEKS